MTVRADITGRYSNRMYAYEPSDIKLCKSEITMFLFFLKPAITPLTVFFIFLPTVLSNMQRALKFLKTELWTQKHDPSVHREEMTSLRVTFTLSFAYWHLKPHCKVLYKF